MAKPEVAIVYPVAVVHNLAALSRTCGEGKQKMIAYLRELEGIAQFEIPPWTEAAQRLCGDVNALIEKLSEVEGLAWAELAAALPNHAGLLNDARAFFAPIRVEVKGEEE